MAKDTRTMKLSAHRAFISDEVQVSLQQILENLQARLPDHQQRVHVTTLLDNAVISEFKVAPANNAIGAVLSMYEPGAKTNTINFKESRSKLEQTETAAQDGEEFLTQNISLLVEGNNVITCGLGRREQLVIATLLDLAVKAGVVDQSANARLAEIPNNPTIADILKHGVTSIDLNMSGLLASLPLNERRGFLHHLCRSTNSETDLELQHSMIANLSIKKKALSVQSKQKDNWINELAISAMNDSAIDKFKIILADKNKTEISADALSLSKKVEVKKAAKSFNVDHAHQLMIEYLRDLHSDGLLE